ncbi:MAG TPA: 2-isopropylmalate synthase [Vicinamibacterales bacterium]|jgi:2-isopropylmalate synthase|nr:2-isopropylmalate synthase [Vicinamibacterales bacterium]
MRSDSERVIIFDTTLRDGEQAPGFSLDVAAKLALARALDALGVDVIEAGFPIASPADAEAVWQIARDVRRPVIAALARCRVKDVEEAARALGPSERRRVHTFLATSDLHLTAKLHMTREACLEAITDGVRLARRFTDDVEFSAEDATRSDRDFLCRAIEAALREGCRTINLPDTVGYATPAEMQAFFVDVRTRVPAPDGVVFSTHCHDDLGLATANSLAAIEGGARQVECTINGIGERAGNAALEELVMALRIRHNRLPYHTMVRPPALFETSQLLTALTDEAVQANKAIVGRNAFAHEAGIHQDGVLKDPRTYEIMRPQDVGQPPARLVLGRHSGRHAVQQRCEAIDLRLSATELEEVYRAVVTMGDHRRAVGDAELRRIVDRVRETESAGPPASVQVEAVGYGHGV